MNYSDYDRIDDLLQKNVMVEFPNGKTYQYCSEFDCRVGDLVEVSGKIDEIGVVTKELPYKTNFYMQNVISAYREKKAQDASADTLFKYKVLNDNEIELTECSLSRDKVEIPQTIQGYKVVKLGDALFKNHEILEEIVVPETVREIGNETFMNCSKLVYDLPESITRIGIECFAGIKSLTIDKNHPHFRLKNHLIMDPKEKIVYQSVYPQMVTQNDVVEYRFPDLYLPDSIEIVKQGFLAASNHDFKISLPETIKRFEAFFLGIEYQGSKLMDESIYGRVDITIRHKKASDETVSFFIPDEEKSQFINVLDLQGGVSVDYNEYSKMFDSLTFNSSQYQYSLVNLSYLKEYYRTVIAITLMHAKDVLGEKAIDRIQKFLKKEYKKIVLGTIVREDKDLLDKYLELNLISQSKYIRLLDEIEPYKAYFSSIAAQVEHWFEQQFGTIDSIELKPTDSKYFDTKKVKGGLEITGYKRLNGKPIPKKIVIPDTINNKKVIGIGEQAFMESNIKVLHLGEHIRYIGDMAFFHEEQIIKVRLNRNLESIGDRCFSHCRNLYRITIPENVKFIGEKAFESSNLMDVTFNCLEGIETLEDGVFDNTDLSLMNPERVNEIYSLYRNGSSKDSLRIVKKAAYKNINHDLTLPSTIEKIEKDAISDDRFGNLWDAPGPRIITIESDNFEMDPDSIEESLILKIPNTDRFKGFKNEQKSKHLVIIKDDFIHDGYHIGVTHNDDCYILKTDGDMDQLVIPSKIAGYPVVGIAPYAFHRREDILSVSYQDSSNLKYIGRNSFSYMKNVTEIHLPETVELIAKEAFRTCRKLNHLDFGNEEANLNWFVLDAIDQTNSLKEVKIPEKTIVYGQHKTLTETNVRLIRVSTEINKDSDQIKMSKETILKNLDETKNFFDDLPYEIRSDKNLMLEVIKKKPVYFKLLPLGLRDDIEIVKEAVFNFHHNLSYVSERLKTNEEVLIKAVEGGQDPKEFKKLLDKKPKLLKRILTMKPEFILDIDRKTILNKQREILKEALVQFTYSDFPKPFDIYNYYPIISKENEKDASLHKIKKDGQERVFLIEFDNDQVQGEHQKFKSNVSVPMFAGSTPMYSHAVLTVKVRIKRKLIELTDFIIKGVSEPVASRFAESLECIGLFEHENRQIAVIQTKSDRSLYSQPLYDLLDIMD